MIIKWTRGLRGRIAAIVGVAALAIVSLNLITYFGGERVRASIEAITRVRMPSIKGLEAMNEGQTAVMQALEILEASSREGVTPPAEAWTRYAAKRKQITEGRAVYDPLPQSPDEEEEYKTKFVDAWKAWEQDCDDFIAAAKKGDRAGIESAYRDLRNTFAPSEASLGRLIAINYQNAQKDRQNSESASSQAAFLSLLLGALCMAFMAGFGYVVARRTTEVLSRLVVRLNQSSDQVAAASQQIAASAEQVSQSVTEQAASISETTASVEEIGAMAAKSSDSAKEAAASAESSRSQAEAGRSAVDTLLSAIREISASNASMMTQVQESNRQMELLVKAIGDIGDKTRVINDIVFQTKLLSFNASVEAARAGEHGKGFAVVAEEVGNLARMSGQAAQEIGALLDASTSNAEKVMTESRESLNRLAQEVQTRISRGSQVAEQCSVTLDSILTDVNKVSALAGEIAGASGEQRQGIGEISKAMAQLDMATQQNSTASEEAAKSAESLAAEAVGLRSAVAELVVAVEGKAEAAFAAVPVASIAPRAPSEFKSAA